MLDMMFPCHFMIEVNVQEFDIIWNKVHKCTFLHVDMRYYYIILET